MASTGWRRGGFAVGLCSIVWLGAATGARADACADIARVKAYAVDRGIAVRDLEALENAYGCGRELAPIEAAEACSDLQTMGFLLGLYRRRVTGIEEVGRALAFVCAAGTRWVRSDPRWRNGRLARNPDRTWVYPNGTRARLADGTWLYPNGRTAIDREGTWYYSDGAVARSTSGQWRAPVEVVDPWNEPAAATRRRSNQEIANPWGEN